MRTSEGGRVAVATIAKGGDHDLVATLQVTNSASSNSSVWRFYRQRDCPSTTHCISHQDCLRTLLPLRCYHKWISWWSGFGHFANFFRLLKAWESLWRAQLKMGWRGWKCFDAQDCPAKCLIRLNHTINQFPKFWFNFWTLSFALHTNYLWTRYIRVLDCLFSNVWISRWKTGCGLCGTILSLTEKIVLLRFVL